MKIDVSFLAIVQSPLAAFFLLCTVVAVALTARSEIRKLKAAGA